MGRYIVAYEGRDTADNRVIEVGALKPRGSRLPILMEFMTHSEHHMGWAEEFGRRLNEETGFTEISFELYFSGDWEDRVLQTMLTPTCAMASVMSPTPYDQPDLLTKKIITSAEITAIGFSVGPNAWGEYPK